MLLILTVCRVSLLFYLHKLKKKCSRNPFFFQLLPPCIEFAHKSGMSQKSLCVGGGCPYSHIHSGTNLDTYLYGYEENVHIYAHPCPGGVVRVAIYIYIYLYLYIYIYMCIFMYIYIYIYIVCIYKYIYVHICVYGYACVCIHIYIYRLACLLIYVYAHIPTYS